MNWRIQTEEENNLALEAPKEKRGGVILLRSEPRRERERGGVILRFREPPRLRSPIFPVEESHRNRPRRFSSSMRAIERSAAWFFVNQSHKESFQGESHRRRDQLRWSDESWRRSTAEEEEIHWIVSLIVEREKWVSNQTLCNCNTCPSRPGSSFS